MYRSLSLLHKRPSLANKFYCLSAARSFCSKNNNEDPPDKTPKTTSKKHQPFSTTKVIKIKSKEEAVQSQQQAKEKIESLIKDAQNLTSVGPNDPQSVSQITGKPKTFIRQSARKSVDIKDIEKDDEQFQTLARGLDKRLVEAARRVASRMPKHVAGATEKELLESIRKQQDETLQAKKKLETDRNIKEDITQSISYQIMSESRTRKSFRKEPVDKLKDWIGSTVERISTEKEQTKLNELSREEIVYAEEDFEQRLQTSNISKSRQVRRNEEFEESRYSVVEKIERRRPRFSSDIEFSKNAINLFSGPGLKIFDPKRSYSELNKNPFWEKLLQEERELSVDFPAMNPFEEMIMWTKEGKLWHYPINNEQGLENDTPFYEHVLLDDLLEGFPDKGPVRQFMELIIMGLSHNPYITVERKHETIAYYKNFFEEKNLYDLMKLDESPAE